MVVWGKASSLLKEERLRTWKVRLCAGRERLLAGLLPLFFGLFDGRTPDKYGWLEPVQP